MYVMSYNLHCNARLFYINDIFVSGVWETCGILWDIVGKVASC